MDSPDYSDSDDSNSTDGHHTVTTIRPKTTDLGKRVTFSSGNDKKKRQGVLRYVGEPEFSEGVWCGVELDSCTGKNNGSVHGIRYFTCESNCGVFVPVSKVELDTSRRSRAHPSSQPSSRSTSVERKETLKPNTPKSNTISPSSGSSVNRLAIQQQDLVNRLAQPIRKSSNSSNVTNRRQPMKAFAPKGMGRQETHHKENKKLLPPFISGGIYKASSTENIRTLKDKDKAKSGSHHQQTQGMPARKSSSEKDLRNSGKAAPVPVKTSNTPTVSKTRRKQVRTSSCSDILSTDTDGNSSSKTSSTNHISSDKKYPWPRTSTPGSRDDLTPDGCSSPEETEENVSKGKQSTSTAANQGFVESPDSFEGKATPLEGVSKEESILGKGLATHAKQFAETEMKSPSLPHLTVQSPDHGIAHIQFYKNRLSGTATLKHPLANSTITNGAQLLNQLIGSRKSVSYCWRF